MKNKKVSPKPTRLEIYKHVEALQERKKGKSFKERREIAEEIDYWRDIAKETKE